MSEIWKPVVGFEGLYEVSDAGRVRALPRTVSFGCGSRNVQGGLKKLVKRRDGYMTVGLGHRNQRLVHRIVLAAFIGPRSPATHTRHLNGIKCDNRLCNLEWGTAKENAADKKVHGTNNNGSKHGNSKLDEGKVAQLLKRRGDGTSHSALAAEFGISRSAVSMILAGKAWGHVCAR